MAANQALIRAAFTEASTRAGVTTPDMSTAIEGSAKATKTALGVVEAGIKKHSDILKELKEEEKQKKAKKDRQLQQFTVNVNNAEKKLFTNKENMPQQVIDQILLKIKDLQEEFETVNTIGDNDTSENNTKRNEINGKLQKLINSAVNTRAGIGIVAANAKNLNPNLVNDDMVDPGSKIFDIDNWEENGISVTVDDNMNLNFWASFKGNEKDGNKEFYYADGVQTSIGGSMDWLVSQFPAADYSFDTYLIDKINVQSKRDENSAYDKVESDYDFEKDYSDIYSKIQTVEDVINLSRRPIQGIGGESFADNIMFSTEILGESIRHLTNDAGDLIGEKFLELLDKDENGTINEEDLEGLSNQEAEIWKEGIRNLTDALVNPDNSAFNLEITRDLMAKFFAGIGQQHSNRDYERADKKYNSKSLSVSQKASQASADRIHKILEKETITLLDIKSISASNSTIGPNVIEEGDEFIFRDAYGYERSRVKKTDKNGILVALYNRAGVSGEYRRELTLPDPE